MTAIAPEPGIHHDDSEEEMVEPPATPRMKLATEKPIKGRIVIYSIVGCPHCVKAKSTLQELGLDYTDISLDRFPSSVRSWLRERTGKQSVPQIFFNDRLVGGNDELQNLLEDDDELQNAIRELRDTEPPDGEKSPYIPHPAEAIDIPSIDGAKFHCEIDEYASLVAEMKKAGVIRNHKRGILCCAREIKDSFTGKDFVDWAVDKKLISRERAIFMGRQLVSRKFGVGIDEIQEFRDDASALYKLGTSDASRTLNASQLAECVQRPALDVAEDLRKLILKLYSEFISDDGKFVNYKALGASEKFKVYKKMTMELQRVNLEKISSSDRTAFFINIYNALVLHGNVEKGTPSNIWQRYKFFSTVSYNIGGHAYSLNDIENGILRANSGSMATLHRKPFGKHDPRLQLALEEAEPRVHFALNCGARSCPPIKVFSGDELETELNDATEAFLETDDAITVDTDDSIIYLSSLFKWYSSDFGSDEEDVLKWIYERLNDEDKKRQVKEVMKKSESYKVKYLPYDWGSNSKKL